jgi:hypothetical protein
MLQALCAIVPAFCRLPLARAQSQAHLGACNPDRPDSPSRTSMRQTEPSISDQTRLDAMRRVNRKLGFLRHLCIYLLVNAGLLILNLSTSRHVLWSLGPLLGWGIGLLFHALNVFAHFPTRWKQAMIERELRRDR